MVATGTSSNKPAVAELEVLDRNGATSRSCKVITMQFCTAQPRTVFSHTKTRIADLSLAL
jgi:hypothetical protein